MTVPLTNEGEKDACQLTKTSLTKEIGHTVPSTKEKSALNVIFPTVHVTKHVVKSFSCSCRRRRRRKVKK
jgi:hypothetical protein